MKSVSPWIVYSIFFDFQLIKVQSCLELNKNENKSSTIAKEGFVNLCDNSLRMIIQFNF